MQMYVFAIPQDQTLQLFKHSLQFSSRESFQHVSEDDAFHKQCAAV